MSASANQYYKVGVLLFPRADILDFTGPMEVLSHVSHNQNPDDPDRMFVTETIAKAPTVRANSALTISVDTTLAEAVNTLADYDMLIVPGAPPSVIQPMVESGTAEIDLIRQFARLSAPTSEKPRVLFSVCTGALLLGAAGILSGATVTTHHRAVDLLREVCCRFNAEGAPQTIAVYKRYVDSGPICGGAVRLITAGGISSGLDATFHLVRELASPEMAGFVSRVMEYDWVAFKS
ncbi:ThiJ/PfpI family protein [Penicillium chermesinum]|uniref:ThiJ/PfpI family protein n=1 Tax=Penicillium chermesinum TaxID=63820 RepID=A0A9W9TJC8_9EURO|nr:ThiJ/PfpI family protein [Penicillium chermesinum]KAJ5223370.1 ThiJ/PfpI family protein [Penicillium chermesinum]KAJ6155791.1 ThiJ/PfpI family protein [Penicillium chermesinum]